MQVNLLKKMSKYVDKDGNERVATNFYLQCGDVKVPVEVKYFKNEQTGDDPNYRSRKTLMSAFADELPDLQVKAEKKTDK